MNRCCSSLSIFALSQKFIIAPTQELVFACFLLLSLLQPVTFKKKNGDEYGKDPQLMQWKIVTV